MKIISKKCIGNSRGRTRRGSGGFTLLEVVIAFGLLAVMIIGFLQLQFSILHTNKIVQLETAGTMVMRRQFEELVAMANENKEDGAGVAKGLLYYLKQVNAQTNSTGNPNTWSASSGGIGTNRIGVALDDDVLTYSFAVPNVGGMLWRPALTGESGDDVSGTGDERRKIEFNELAIGTIKIYLGESTVPSEFYSWGDVGAAGGFTPSGLPGFDMNDNRVYTEVFTGLLTSDSATAFPASTLLSLPMRGEIAYYKSKKDMELAVPVPYYTVRRTFVINDNAFNSLDPLGAE